MKKITVLAFIILSIISGCTFNNEDDYFKGYVCDTVNMNYSQVNSIFQENCVSCHNKDFNNRGIILDSYEGIVAAEDSDRLYKAVNHLPGNGIRIIFMPYQLNKLPSCPLAKINAWIKKGMPQN